MADRDLLVPPIDTTPEDRSIILGEVYRPRRQSEFLLGMLRTLASGSVALLGKALTGFQGARVS